MFSTTLFSGSNIRITKHNLSNKTTDIEDDELCVYCHTPNASKSSFVNSLEWDKSMKMKSFVMYGSNIVEGDMENGNNNPSMACLGCHDGINAINVFASLSTRVDNMHAKTAPSIIESDIMFDGKKNHPISVAYTPGLVSLKEISSSLDGWAGAKKISDLLRNNKIECGSCHDPHEATNGTFLRTANHGSSICIGCHAK